MTTFDDERLDELRRAVLEKRVRAGVSGRATETQSSTSHSGPLPLSGLQNQLWYLSQLMPESRAYNELIAIRKTGSLDVNALRRALTEVVRRHEALRTTFSTIDGVPHQFVQPPTEFELPLLDLSHVDPVEAEAQAIRVAAADTSLPYDLTRGPLVRGRLIRIGPHDHRLYLYLHHLVFDGVTLHTVVYPELTALYRSYSRGEPPSLPEPNRQYSDYTLWERRWAAGAEVADRIARWRERLTGATPTLVPVDHPRTPQYRYAGGTIPFAIDHRTVEGLRNVARGVGGTLFHALAAAYAWWMRSYTGSDDVTFGTPHDMRYRKEDLTVAGYCVTPLVVRCEVPEGETFTALVARIRDVVTDAVSDAVPFETLLRELDVARDPRNDPLFQTTLVLRPPLPPPVDEWSLHDVVEADVLDAVGATKFDISIELTDRPEGHLTGRFFFSTELFERDTAGEMVEHWRRLLEAVARAPGVPITEHDLVTADDRRRQLSWNPPPLRDVPPGCIHDILCRQADLTPDAVAVQIGDEILTYRQLDSRAVAIASQLASAGIGRGAVVATLLDRSADLVAAVIGILKCGAAFLPLDPRQPAARNSFTIADAGAALVLTAADLADSTVEAGDGQFPSASPDDLACIVYTSGSTGRPKGVLLEHRSIVNLMHTMFRTFGVDKSDTVLSASPINFDLGIGDIFCTLGCGARLVLATEDQAADPVALQRLISSVGATYMMSTPTMWSALVGAGWTGGSHLTVASAGEPMSDALANELVRRCRAVWNCWGPTETTIITGGERLAPGDTITVGKPFPGVRVYVIDRRGRITPIGVPGEIAVGGIAVARGYLNRPDEQRGRFVDDPYDNGERIYRTGDRGRFLPDGRLQVLGRYDDQVKIRGFRIEPGEIETVLREHPAVRECAVVARDAPNGERRLVAYVVGDGTRLADSDARDWLRRLLPEYMIPAAFVHLQALPKTPRGKLDKAALPTPRREPCPADQRPRNKSERRVAALWSDLLGVQVTDVTTDFFDLGGHSMLAARLIFEVERTFGIPISLPEFLDGARTVAKMAAFIDDSQAAGIGTTDAGAPPLHFVFPDLGCAMAARHFAAQWGVEQPVHPLRLVPPDEPFDTSQEIHRLAAEAVQTIRKRQPSGPYALAGFSLGAIVAYDAAAQLTDAGERVDWLGIFDTPPPPLMRLMRTRWMRLRRLQRRPFRERCVTYRQVGRRVLRRGVGALRALPAGDRRGRSPVRQYDIQVAREIICSYPRAGHTLPVHLFVTEGSASQADAPVLGWDGYHGGPLHVYRFPGDHVALLDQPLVTQLAETVLKSLRDAQIGAYGRQA